MDQWPQHIHNTISNNPQIKTTHKTKHQRNIGTTNPQNSNKHIQQTHTPNQSLQNKNPT